MSDKIKSAEEILHPIYEKTEAWIGCVLYVEAIEAIQQAQKDAIAYTLKRLNGEYYDVRESEIETMQSVIEEELKLK